MPGNNNANVGTQARGINSRNEIVGWFTDAGGQNHGFLRTRNGDFRPIDFPGSAGTQALQVNDRGDIVGTYSGGHGFLLKRSGSSTAP
jgi:probable HAF family extracellular repeat protein